MKTSRTISDLEKIKKGCVLTIGNFDGVHIGHQKILATARQTATQRATELLVMIFDPHPLVVLSPQKKPNILTPLALKKNLLAEFGADHLFVVKSTRKLLSLSPQEFVERFFVKNIQPGIIVEGRNFNFGSGRTGTVNVLQNLGAEKGFEVSVVDSEETKLSTGQTVTVSSTLIRGLLENGSVADAAVALGRTYRLIGKIVPGKGKGKQLGFPTLNMESPQQLVPGEGVYAGFVQIGDGCDQVCEIKEKKSAVFSIGRTQTIGTEYPLLIEAHLLDENPGDLNNKWLAMDFVEHLRNQQKFETESALSAQIAKDCKKAKKILSTDSPEKS